MAQEQFKPGDVVVLKSGGDPMTIRDVGFGQVTTNWFDGKSKLHDGTFSIDQILTHKKEGS